MPELVSKPKGDWSVERECDGQLGCKHVYRYFKDDIRIASFKVSGYWFDGSAVTERKTYVDCAHCGRLLFVNVPQYIARQARNEDD